MSLGSFHAKSFRGGHPSLSDFDETCTVEEKTDIQELVGLCNQADNNNYCIAGPSKNIPSPFKRALFWLQREDREDDDKDLFNIKYQDLISIMPQTELKMKDR
ncbi:hypothetical protein AVEN_162309-1 [Araneus ventricosus]|uniref:Uncharacterized protein n=1 Tax=Araneus ventricosus TaxID=182803 RepID=A0A4Y2LUT3_ARAVE|nr:hypothetical protein AVEN_162309-1 [Araneus ventricosus]